MCIAQSAFRLTVLCVVCVYANMVCSMCRLCKMFTQFGWAAASTLMCGLWVLNSLVEHVCYSSQLLCKPGCCCLAVVGCWTDHKQQCCTAAMRGGFLIATRPLHVYMSEFVLRAAQPGKLDNSNSSTVNPSTRLLNWRHKLKNVRYCRNEIVSQPPKLQLDEGTFSQQRQWRIVLNPTISWQLRAYERAVRTDT
jgi:hypothetical protein